MSARALPILVWNALLAGLLLGPLSAIARGERLAITTYSSAEGLPGSYVTEVTRDSRGFVWFGTRDGVSRFDGARFVNYGVEHGLADPTVNDIIESRTGGHWVATNGGGVCHLSADAASRDRSDSDDAGLFECASPGDDGYANRVNALHEDPNGRIWAGTDGGLFQVDAAQRPYRFVPIALPGIGVRTPAVSQIIADGAGGAWIGTNAGLVHRDASGAVRHHRLRPDATPDDEFVTRLLVDREGRLWIGYRGGLMVIRPQGDRLPTVSTSRAERLALRAEAEHTPLTLRLPAGPGDRLWIPIDVPRRQGLVRGLFEASDRTIWISTTRGLLHVEGNTLRIYTTAHGLMADDLRGLAEDRDGNLWIGSVGAMKLTRRGFVTYSTADGLGDATVHGIFETRQGQLRVVSGDWIVNALEGDRFRAVPLRMPSDTIRSWGSQVAVLDSRERWWLLASPGVWRLPPAAALADLGAALPPSVHAALSPADTTIDSVLRLHEDRRGDVWLSLSLPPGRIVRIDGATGRSRLYGQAEGVPHDLAAAIGEDARGQIWIGFRTAGIARLQGDRFTVFDEQDGVPPGAVTAFHTDVAGRLWMGTTRGGLARVEETDSPAPRFVRYTTTDGLGSNNVRSLTSDLQGRIYAGTARGIDRLDGSYVRRYTTVDGLANGLATAAYRDAQGRLWFGTSHGLSRLDPTPEPARTPPSVWIGAVRMAGRPRPTSHLGTRTLAPVTLGPTENQVEVEFFGLTFAMGETLRYQYRLEGADERWSAPAPEQRVHYSALAPGQYTFLVRAVSADGLVSAAPASIPFTVLPPLWQRAWFRALVLGFGVLAAAVVYRARVARLLELERVRTRIASDLHDDIGSNLSRMAILSEVAKRQIAATGATDADEGPARHLTEIAESARTLIDSMSDIVWSIDPRHDDLGSVIVRVRAFASDVLTTSGVKWSCVAPPDLDRIRLRPDARRHLLLLLKEGVTNIARHAQADSARLLLEIEGPQLVAELSDDGRGFAVEGEAMPASRGGHGRSSMQWRAAELKGTLRTISAPGAGTHIRLTMPLRATAGAPHGHAMAAAPPVRHDRPS